MAQREASRLRAEGFSALVGLERVRADGGESEVRLVVRPHHLNALGVVHGGVLMSLADEAIGLAAFSAVPAGTAAVTAELHLHFLLPARGRVLVARGRIWRSGRRLVTGEAVIEEHATDEAAARPGEGAPSDGVAAHGHEVKVVARASGTWATVTPAVPLP